MPRQFPYGDLKYFYTIHCRKQELQGKKPVSYNTFSRRLNKLNLHDAIYYPRVEKMVRTHQKQSTINDYHRRIHVLNEENVPVLDMECLKKIEEEKPVIYPRKAKQPKTSKPKQSLFLRFISLFKK